MKKSLLLFFAMCSFSFLMAANLNWNTPDTLSTPMVDATSPKIVMDSSGNLTMIWLESGGALQANYMPAGGSWGSITTVVASGASSPMLAVDQSSGSATAAWVEGGVVKTATAANGSWGSASALSSSGASDPQIAVDNSGNVANLWVRNGFIEASVNAGNITTLSPANSSHPVVAIGADGTVVALWSSLDSSSNSFIQSSKQTIGGSWGTPKNVVQLSTAFQSGFPALAVDARGNALATAYRYQINNGEYINVGVYASLLPAGASAWQAIPTLLSASSDGLRNPADFFNKVVFDQEGNALAMWGMSYDDSTFSIESATLPLGGIWSTPVPNVQNGLYAFSADISANALGAVVSAYMFWDGSNLTIQNSEANISGVLGSSISWPSPVQISTLSNNAYPKIASLYSDGVMSAAAAWESFDGTNTIVQAATGSRTTTETPSDLTITPSSTDLGVYTDNANIISWSPSSSPNLAGYGVYFNGTVFAFVSPSTLEVTLHSINNPSTPATYGVAAIDNDTTQSEIITTVYP